MCIFAIGLYHYYTDETYFKDDSAGVARWLAEETTANDVVFVDVPHPFHYYTTRYHIPAPTRYLFVDIHTAAQILTSATNQRDRLYWVTWQGSDTDPRGVINFLAEKHGRQLGQVDFRGYHVNWFALLDEPFSLPNQLKPVEAVFGDVLHLDEADFGIATLDKVWVTLHFDLLHETQVDYRVSVRLRNDEGQITNQTDRDLLNDRHFRSSAWPITDEALNQAVNVYLIPIPSETPAGRYQIEVVVYDAEPPYPSEGVTGPASVDGVMAIIGTVHTLGVGVK
jgi:hypothetical protein